MNLPANPTICKYDQVWYPSHRPLISQPTRASSCKEVTHHKLPPLTFQSVSDPFITCRGNHHIDNPSRTRWHLCPSKDAKAQLFRRLLTEEHLKWKQQKHVSLSFPVFKSQIFHAWCISSKSNARDSRDAVIYKWCQNSLHTPKCTWIWIYMYIYIIYIYYIYIYISETQPII